MIFRWQRFRTIETADCDIDFIRKIIEFTSERRAAVWTETPRAFSRGPKVRGLTGNKPEPSFWHTEPGYEGRAASTPAD